MKPSTTLALSAMLSLAVAQPLVEKRDDTTITVTDVVVVVTDVTITVGPSTAPAAATTKHAGHIAYHAQGKAEAQAQPSPAPSPPQVQKAAIVQEKAANPPAPPTSAAAPPAGSSPEQIQAAEDASQEAVNQKQTDINNKQKQADFAHQNQMNAQQNGGGAAAPVAAAPAPPSPAPQTPAHSSGPPPSGGSGSGGKDCGDIGARCSGDVTIYNDQGLGACGWSNDTNSQDFFALAHDMFGLYTNNYPGNNKNAFCGRMATIKVGSNSFNGMLTDKCGGCAGQSIDLSQHLYSQLYPDEPPASGRHFNVDWEFTSGPIYSPA